MKLSCERQHGKTLNKIAPDHISRYLWAAEFLKRRLECGRILDIACGTGYGSYLLAQGGFHVDAVDISEKARRFQEKYYAHPNVRFILGDALTVPLGRYDAIISFETIEHIEKPHKLIERFDAPIVIVSVPNEAVNPYNKEDFPYHFRHYCKEELDFLLPGKKTWFTQHGKWEDFGVTEGDDGKVLIVALEK